MKKKTLVMLLLMVLFFPLVWTKSSQATGETYIVTPEIGVNLRVEPKQEGATVTKLKQGYRVETLEKSGEWMKVSYEGKEGYVKSEHLKPLDIDLVAAYKHYATVLEETMGGWTYSLLYDFTQDGLEELYIVEEQDGWLRHRMFSGETELFDELIHDDKGELTIYWEDYNYYIVTHSYYFSDSSYKPSEVGIPSQHELVHAHMVFNNINVIHSGNLALNKMRMGMESSQVIKRFETNGEEFEVGENNFEIDLYSIEEKKVTKEQWEKVEASYRNTPNHLVLYAGREDISNFDETVDKLSALYGKYTDSPTRLSLEESKVEEIKWYTCYSDYMFNRKSINDNSGEIDYFELLNMALYYSDDSDELYDGESYTYKYPKLKIDEWIYSNFGIRLDNQQVEDHVLRYETAYEKEHGTDHGLISIGVHDEYYTKSINGDGIILTMGEEEPEIINSRQLENDFLALEYVMLGPIRELSIMNAKPDYIIVKKVETTKGETYYPYIDTVQTLENIDYDALNNYAEKLDVVKDNKQVEQGKIAEESGDQQNDKTLGKESKEQSENLGEKQGETTNYTFYILIIVGGLIVSVTSVMIVRKRKTGDKIKKTTPLVMTIFVVIVIGAAIFIIINPSQSKIEPNRSLDDHAKEDGDAVVENDQVDASKTDILDVNDEHAVRTFYDDFRKDYENALNNGDFNLVSNYFEDGSTIKQSYKEFVGKHRDWDFDYNYTFLTNTAELEVINADTLVVTAHEVFELYKQGSNPEKEKNERIRNYTLKLIGSSFYISSIENLNNASPIKETTKSTNGGTKSDYLSSIQYAEDLTFSAGSNPGSGYKLDMWEAHDAWDDELNRIYGLLKEKLSSQKMEALRTEQRAWIKERDELTADPDEIGYLTRVELLHDLTAERTMYLIDMYFDEESN